MKGIFLSLVMVCSISACAVAQTAEDHFNEVVKNVKSSSGRQYSYHGLYPGMSRQAAIDVTKTGDKIIVLEEDPSSKAYFLYEINEPRAKVSIEFPNFGRDIPETRNNSEIRSHLVKINRIAPRNAMFDKDKVISEIISEIISELGEPDTNEIKGPTHNLYYGFNRQASGRKLYTACVDEFKENNPKVRMPSELGQAFNRRITVEAVQIVMDNCPATLDLYKEVKTKELSPWVWISFNEKKRDFYIMMNYVGEEYLSPHKKGGPLYNK